MESLFVLKQKVGKTILGSVYRNENHAFVHDPKNIFEKSCLTHHYTYQFPLFKDLKPGKTRKTNYLNVSQNETNIFL